MKKAKKRVPHSKFFDPFAWLVLSPRDFLKLDLMLICFDNLYFDILKISS
jgi:hypothetical protein